MNLFLVYLEVKLLHEEVAYHLPTEILEECRCLFLDFLFGELALVDVEKPSLEELLRKFNVSFLHEVIADILRELVVRLLFVVVHESLFYCLVELLWIVNLILTEDLVVGLLVLLCRSESLDFLYSHVELRINALELLFLHLKHVSTVRLVCECLSYIDIELITYLSSEE